MSDLVKILGKKAKFYVSTDEVFLVTDRVARLTSVGEIGPEVGEVTGDPSLDDEAIEALPGSIDFGSFDISGYLINNSESGYKKLRTLADNATVFNWMVTHPQATDVNMKGKGWFTSFKRGELTPEGFIMFSGSIRISGAPVYEGVVDPEPEPEP